jgi:hypothetical protein
MSATASSSQAGRPARRYAGQLLFLVKAFHSLAFFVIQASICYLLYKGVRRQTDRKAGVAAGIAAAETLIYAGNRCRCPLTGLAESLGAERGSVTDLFLPQWLASNIAQIYGPLFAAGLWLHARNLAKRPSDRLGRARLTLHRGGPCSVSPA